MDSTVGTVCSTRSWAPFVLVVNNCCFGEREREKLVRNSLLASKLYGVAWNRLKLLRTT